MKALTPNLHVRVLMILSASLFVPPEFAGAQHAMTAVVYYQATYSDGSVRDLTIPPTTKKDIRSVLRIARYESPLRSYVVRSTYLYPPVTEVNPGRTIRREMHWDGKAWIAPVESPDPPRTTGSPTRHPEKLKQTEIRRIERKVSQELKRLNTLQQAVNAAEKKLADAKGSNSEPPARQKLQNAKAARDACQESIQSHQRLLKVLRTDAKLDHPTGKVERTTLPPTNAYGINHPIDERRIVPHHVQVWKLPEGEGKRTYTVTMAHPEPGALSAFHYVAYADTDADGLPDKLIAHSPLSEAVHPGQWTRWSFTTDKPRVFVGNAWPHAETSIYYCPVGGAGVAYNHLGTDVYVSGWFGGIPWRRWGRFPYLTNIRVWVANQNPDLPSPATGSKIIIK